MWVETLLPLGKLDPGLRAPEQALDLDAVPDDASRVEALGYDGLVVEETKDDPFQVMALAAHATTTLRLGTSVAMAFPRSPTVTAMAAWTLQKLSGGRFTLGLGSPRCVATSYAAMAWSGPRRDRGCETTWARCAPCGAVGKPAKRCRIAARTTRSI